MYARLPLTVSSAVARVCRIQTDHLLCRTGGSDTVSVPSRASTIGLQYVKTASNSHCGVTDLLYLTSGIRRDVPLPCRATESARDT